MSHSIWSVFTLILFTVATFAKTIVVTVGGNTTNDATKVFQPTTVTAQNGDTVFFNFTQGNHTVTQSTFASPCIPAHETNVTINGFDSSFRNAGAGTAITNLEYTVTDSSTTVWFYDSNTCARGGVGAININGSSSETIDGFRRNAIRLNGTSPSSSTSASGTASSTAASPTATLSNNSSPRLLHGAAVVIPFLIAALCF
ncbi:hypothetical protein Hypma_007603 [Hypsizygus marmoreus]|uniref:Extracellular serine-rich protein n=1 Tax=Hypsizygus marmoreus TaxID=39966 RepID=A0A369K3L9_HYPMA|nr:hypothetical protein Hypma_007603 [Hypsizygus marmoreus]